MRTEFLCVSVLRVASGPRVKLASCKSALNPTTPPPPPPPGSLFYWPFWGGGPGVVPTLCTFFFYMCCDAIIVVTVFNSCPLCFLFNSLCCDADVYVFPCVILFLCFSVLLVLRLPRLGKRELILVLFVRLFDLCLFGFVGFLFLLGSGTGFVLWLWHSLDFSLTFISWLKLRLSLWSLHSLKSGRNLSCSNVNFSFLDKK